MDQKAEFQQKELIDFLVHVNPYADEVVVHLDYQSDKGNKSIFPVLIKPGSVQKELEHADWNFHGRLMPDVTEHYNVPKYHRFDHEEEIEPLVILQRFDGLRSPEIDLLEEFRLYHNMFKLGSNPIRYYKYDRMGRELLVCTCSQNEVRIRRQYLHEFLAAKQYALLLCFVSHMTIDSEALKDNLPDDFEETKPFFYNVRVYYNNSPVKRESSFSRLLGKHITMPPSLDQCGIWPFYKEVFNYVSFVIDIDPHGKSIEFTCNPDELSNFFGANPGAPNFLTPVLFKEDVLQKYYADDSKYEITDYHVKCGYLWSLPIDRNVEGVVGVYLGDLGSRLDYEEQEYWRRFNVESKGRISPVAWKRDFMATYAAPIEPAHRFIYIYNWFQDAHKEHYGFPLFRPLGKGDTHRLVSFRIPLSQGWNEFDEQITTLSKLLFESVNVHQLRDIDPDIPGNTGQVTVLGRYLENKTGLEQNPEYSFIKTIEALRHGISHTKGKKYFKCFDEAGYTPDDKISYMRHLVDEAIYFVTWLEKLLIPEDLRAPRE